MVRALWTTVLGLAFASSAHPSPDFSGPRPAWRSSLRQETDRDRAGLLGPVRKVTTWEANSSRQDGKEVETGGTRMREDSYDSRGNLTEHKSYGPNGLLVSTHVHVYGLRGEKKRLLIYREDGSLLWTRVHRYDPNGVLTGWIWMKYDKDDSVLETVTHTLHAMGWVTERIVCNAKGHIERKHLFTYNAAGDLIEDVRVDGDGSPLSRFRYTYGSSGNKTTSTYLAYDDSGEVQFEHVCLFDARGILISEAHRGAEGSPEEEFDYDYEFDSVGNWIKQTKLIPLTGPGERRYSPLMVIYRTITYYPGVRKRSGLRLDRRRPFLYELGAEQGSPSEKVHGMELPGYLFRSGSFRCPQRSQRKDAM
jgi:hypothetical protein